MPTEPAPDRHEDAAGDRLEVAADRLRRRLDPSGLPFETTADVDPLHGTIGQPRALDALAFGLEITTQGYNLFVAGAPGSGRVSTVRDHLEQVAPTRTVPGDWIYVHNFAQPDRPRAIGLPTGMGRRLAADMDGFVTAAQREMVRAFESEEYPKRQAEVLAEVEQRQQTLRKELDAFAAERGFAVQVTPMGIGLIPTRDGHPMTPEEIGALEPAQRTELEGKSEEIHEQLQADLRQVKLLEREGLDRVLTLNRAVAMAAIGPLLQPLRERYAAQPGVLDHLTAVAEDVPQHLPELRGTTAPREGSGGPALQDPPMRSADPMARYRVNVLVDNGGAEAAPVVIERNPSYYNLLGRVEYRAQFGSAVTDFSQIRAGALHRANGGFLVIEAADVLTQPFSWEALKRALRNREVVIENLAEQLSPVPTATLRPEPVPLDIKVVLIGSPLLHVLLHARDDDLRELFKVKVDFASEIDWTDDHVMSYAGVIARWVRQDGLRHFDRSAVARVVEHGAWLREDQRKLSTRLLDISDLVTEAAFWSEKAGHEHVLAEDVDMAVTKKVRRSNLLEERMQELISERTVVIETEGAVVGQVNGLSVIELGDHSFGLPVRITATAAVGRGRVASIERETEMSGRIHSKGFLILSGYLAQTYAQELPLALAATLTFEQSYDEIDGDSASSAELYALLSALSGLPLAQGIAVTGSINQHGEVQAVGGVTRKVEGFFAVCEAHGLTGSQGVVVPAANVTNLMLSEAVVDAVRHGRFHVFAVRTVDEGIELLTGHPAGTRDGDGYAEGTVHHLVDARLRGFAERLRGFPALS